MSLDPQSRDVRAGLSLFVGRSLPSGLFDLAGSLGLPIGGWTFRSVSADPGRDGEWTARRLCQFGRARQDAAAAAGVSLLVPGDPGWPAGTGGDELPCLWVRGTTDIAGLLGEAVAITGTSTAGDDSADVAAGLAVDLAGAGWTVITSTDAGIDRKVTDAVLRLPGAVPLLVTAGGLDPASSPGDRREATAGSAGRGGDQRGSAGHGAVASAYPRP